MLNRYIPYGYYAQDAQILVNGKEAEVIRSVFRKYISGASLREIVADLTLSGTEYLPGKSNWDKARVSRMLGNEKYVGKDLFPGIVTKETFTMAQQIRNSKNTKKNSAVNETVTEAAAPIICGKCGWNANRRNVYTSRFLQKHVCRNPECKKEYFITDEKMSEMILELLRSAKISLPINMDTSMETRKAENEIERLLETPDADTTMIRRRIFDLAAEKYRLLTVGLAITDKLRADLAPANLSSSNIRKTVLETVKQITLMDNDTIEITLINGQVLGKELTDGNGHDAEKYPDHPADHPDGAEKRTA